MQIGQRIRERRLALRLTQKQVADAVGARERYVSDWELEKGIPNTRYLLPLAQALETSTDFLLSGNDELRKATA